MSPDLPRLPDPRRRPTASANAATYAALIGLCLVGFAFLGVVLIVLPFRGLGIMLLGTVGFFGAHYLLWGRVLTKLRQEEEEARREFPDR